MSKKQATITIDDVMNFKETDTIDFTKWEARIIAASMYQTADQLYQHQELVPEEIREEFLKLYRTDRMEELFRLLLDNFDIPKLD